MLGSNNYLGLTGDERVKRGGPRRARPLRHRPDRLAPAQRHDAAAPRARARDRRVDGRRGRDRLHHRPPGQRRARSGRSSPPATPSIADSADHASILDGCLLSRAKLRPFRHGRLDKLERQLQRAGEDGGGVLVVVDGVFSMEGDVAPLAEIVRALPALRRAAHGRRGARRRRAGRARRRGGRAARRRGPRRPAHGHVLEVARLLRRLRDGPGRGHRLPAHPSRAFLFTASNVPAALGAALAALRIVRSDEGRELMARVLGNAAPPARRAARAGAQGHRARDRHTRRPRPRRGRLEGRPAVAGALRRRRLHERRDPSRRCPRAARSCARA